MRKILVVFAFLFLLYSVHSTAAVVGASESPLADAGLDQTVTRGTTVLLDGTGSRDPDGSIQTYEWSIETPTGDTIAPTPPRDPRPQFTPTEIGTYNVTLTVTDNDGKASTDWLRVTVLPGQPPSVELEGPRELQVGGGGTYTATIDAGTARLDYVVWRTDGDVISNRSLSGQRATETITRTFPSAGQQTISATVYDADGLDHRDSITVSVERGSGSGDSRPAGPSIADGNSPTIRGPQLVTGALPLEGAYSITGVTEADVTSVRWKGRTGTYGSGTSERIGWTPGNHQLYAVVDYADGSRDIARFSDGSMGVIADPKPTVRIGNVNTYGSLSGSPGATDSYGNLRTLTVEVDGEEVATSEVDAVELQQSGSGYSLEGSFNHDNIRPGESHTVTVIATDARGQRTTETVEKTPVGKPEIVTSEFVNGPVDSYHERIDASRYAAHHVLKIDLNGVDSEDIEVGFEPTIPSQMKSVNAGKYEYDRRYRAQSDTLVIDSYWAGVSPETHKLDVTWTSKGGSQDWEESDRAIFKVTPSKPELRYEVIDDGTIYDKRDWGIIVDASDSFDPDGTKLEYIWGYGANPIVADNSTAKFDSWRRANLTLIDGDNQKTKVEYDYLSRYNPGIERVEPVSDEPYKPNEVVRVRVFTNAYKLTKNRYDVPLGIEIEEASGTVTEWRAIKMNNGECIVENCAHPGIENKSELHIDNRRYTYYKGIIELDASAFADGTTEPTVVVYNEENPEQTVRTKRITGINVLTKGSTFWENVTVSNLEYTVEKPIISYVTTQSESARDQFIEDGYAIKKTETGTEFVLEKLVQTQEAEYETRTKSFQQSKIRDVFLSENPDWKSGDSYSTTRTWTTTETDWRDTKGGKGTFTGNTRRVKTDSADYRTKKQYEYDYEVEKTGTRTDWRTKPISVRKTRTKTVTKCNRYVGCYESTETYSYWTTEYVTYSVTETYTYTVTRTDSYWAYSPKGYDHRFTGRTQRIKVDDADYTTQYEFQYDVEHSESVWHYEATRKVQTQEAIYEWQEQRTTTDKAAAKTLARTSDSWRIGDTNPTPKWTLTKYDGTKTTVVSSYDDPGYVVETRATVTGDVKQKYINTATGGVVIESLGTSTQAYTAERALTEEEIVDEFGNSVDDDDPISKGDSRWCELKNNCG